MKHLNQFDADRALLNLKNGMFNIDTLQLLPHDPKLYPSIRQLPISYDQSKECKKINDFFNDVLEAKDVDLIAELFGFLLTKNYKIHKAFMFYGSGRNGKGTMLRLVEAFMGVENVSHVSLEQLANNRFAASKIVGKLVNINGDIPQRDLSSTETFKQLTGEDIVQMEAKYSQPFDYLNQAKMIFAANKLPRSPDDTSGFYSRWLIVLFKSKFTKPNPKLDEELSEPDELSGLLNFALKGLKRLKENEYQFSYDLSEKEVRLIYLRYSDPAIAFLMDCCESYDGYIAKNELYKSFKEYVKKNNLPILSAKMFSSHIQQQNYLPIETIHQNVNNERAWVWSGIRLKKSEKQISQEVGATA